VGNRLAFIRRQPEIDTGLQHTFIQIDAPCIEPCSKQDLEPLASPAPEVDGGNSAKFRNQWFDKRAVELEPARN
jgi:hypothetical protein